VARSSISEKNRIYPFAVVLAGDNERVFAIGDPDLNNGRIRMLKSIRNGFAADAEDFFENDRIDDNHRSLGLNMKSNFAIACEMSADRGEGFSEGKILECVGTETSDPVPSF